MSTTAELLAHLNRLGVKLWDDDGYLGYSAPKGALTPTLRTELAAHKADILDLLRQSERSGPTPAVEPGGTQETHFPLSYGQQALWVVYQQAPESPAYNMGVSLHIQAHLDVPTLQRALQSLVDRHAALRTTFSMRDGLLTQDTHGSPPLELEQVAAAGTWNDLMQQVQTAHQRPFDLERGPVFRATLFTTAPTAHVLLLTLHHIAGDAASFWILLGDLQVLYTAYKRGQTANLTELGATYADFVRWEHDLVDGVSGERLSHYWQQQLAGEIPVLNLPTDRPRPAVQTYRGASCPFELDPALSAQLKALAQAEQTTLFTLLLSAFQILLHRYTAQEEIWVGSPSGSGRSQTAFSGIVGYLINPLVFRARFDDAAPLSFRDFLKQGRQTVLEALDHQAYPFPLLVQQLQPARHASHPPLFQAAFVLDAARFGTEPQGDTDLPISPLGLDQMEGQFDLTLTLADGENLTGAFSYNADVFEAATVERMAGHWQVLLASIVANPEQPLHALPLLTESERHQLLVEWNDTGFPFEADQCVHQLVEQQAARAPEAVAVEFEGQQLTYGALNRRANQLAHYLQRQGVGHDVRVGICVERSLDMVVGVLAILKAGGAYVPLEPTYPSERLAFMMQDSEIAILVTQSHLIDQLPLAQQSHLQQAVCLDRDWPLIARECPDNPLVQTLPDAQQLAYVMYTSGSTGTPKAVMTLHCGFRNLVQWYNRVFAVTAADRIMQFANLAIDASTLELWPTLTAGGRLHLIERDLIAAPQSLQDWLIEHGTTVINIPTLITEQFVAMAWPVEMALRLAVTGGEQLHQTPPAQLPFEVANSYGPTENSMASTWFFVPPESPPKPPIGRPLDNHCVYILDPHLQPVPIGVAGELCAGGIGVSRGYFNRPGLTADKFIPNPFRPGRLYKTGDWARYLPDGNIEFLGRIDNQVKLRGFRIELGEIESALLQCPGVKECAVVVRATASGQKQIAAYIVSDASPSNGDGDYVATIRTHLKRALLDYMVPTAYVTLDALPLTSSGKVNHQALPAPDRADLQSHTDFTPPRTSTETRLAAMWTQVLDLEQIGIHDHFFELGGHSLLATRLLADIETQLSKKLPLASLFEAPTIAQLAPLLIEAPPTQPWSPVVPIQPVGSQPALFCLPGGAAHVFYFWELARYLGAEQPFYGLQPPGHEEGAIPLNRMSDFVKFFSESLQQVQPQGPYLLGGHSSGGYIALALALALRQQGQDVPVVVILDAIPPGVLPGDESAPQGDNLLVDFVRVAQAGLGDRLPLSIDELQTLSGDAAWQYVVEGYKKVNLLPPQAGINQLRRMHDVYRGTSEAAAHYHPQDQFDGQLLFFQTSEINVENPEMVVAGWQALCTQPIGVYPVPGNHQSMVTTPHVKVLAQQMQTAIGQALNHQHDKKGAAS